MVSTCRGWGPIEGARFHTRGTFASVGITTAGSRRTVHSVRPGHDSRPHAPWPDRVPATDQASGPARPWWWPPYAGIRIPAPLSNLGPGSTTRVVGPVTGRDFRPGASLIVAPWCVCDHRPLCRPPARDPRPCRGEDQSTVDFRPGVSRHGSAGRCRAATGRWPFRDQARRRGAPTGPAPRATGRPARPAGFPTFVGSAGRRRLRPWGHDSD